MNYNRNMNQAATYFAPLPVDEFGSVQYAGGVQIAVRWEDRNELFRDSEGREVVANSVVYCAVPVALRGRLALGTGAAVGDGREIRHVHRSPSLDGARTLVKVLL